MRKILTVMVLFVGIIVAKAQQEAHYTQFTYNYMVNNPAFTGARRISSVSVLYRNQWMGYEGNPKSYLATFDAPINNGRLGTGLILSNQSEGITRRQAANLTFSYAAIKTKETTLRIGMSMTLRQYRYDLQDPSIYIRERQDASLAQDNPSITSANVGMGVYFDTESFYAGISVPNLNKNAIVIGANANAQLIGREQPHIYFMGGARLPIGDDIEFKPALMYKYAANAPFSIDANMSVMFQKRFTAGFSYRIGESRNMGESIDLLTFVQATDRLGIGISYDYTLSEIRSYSSGSIEALLRYDIGRTKGLKNPRFFF